MEWLKATQVAENANCSEALPLVIKPTSDRKPPPNAPSTVVCKEKMRQDAPSDNCTVINGSSCPKGRR
jgi:hypothetical protein